MKKGFTLIEILIVIIIVSTLAALAAPQYLKVIERFRVLEATSTIMEIRKAQERYKLRKGQYTQNFSELDLEIKNINNEICNQNICEMKYFLLRIILYEDYYIVLAQRKTNEQTKPPQRYSENYIYFYDSKEDKFKCTDENCVKDFID